MPRQQYLDEPYILERVTLQQIQQLLLPLAHNDASALPVRMRTRCAMIHRRCASMARELYLHPESILNERRQEETPPLVPLTPRKPRRSKT